MLTPINARKKMPVSPEEFFFTALAHFGPPDLRASNFTYWANGFYLRGLSAWCLHHERGQRWTALVVEMGEAKTRAYQWYSKYCSWWRDQGEGTR